MKKTTYAAVFAAIALAGFSGADFTPFVCVPACAQDVATGIAAIAKNFSPEQNLDISGTKLVYKNLPAGVSAKIVGTTYEQLIGFDGKIRNPLSPKTTKVTFELTDAAGNKAVTPTFELSVPVAKISPPKPTATRSPPSFLRFRNGAAAKENLFPPRISPSSFPPNARMSATRLCGNAPSFSQANFPKFSGVKSRCSTARVRGKMTSTSWSRSLPGIPIAQI